jgi:hypothetical protein
VRQACSPLYDPRRSRAGRRSTRKSRRTHLGWAGHVGDPSRTGAHRSELPSREQDVRVRTQCNNRASNQKRPRPRKVHSRQREEESLVSALIYYAAISFVGSQDFLRPGCERTARSRGVSRGLRPWLLIVIAHSSAKPDAERLLPGGATWAPAWRCRAKDRAAGSPRIGGTLVAGTSCAAWSGLTRRQISRKATSASSRGTDPSRAKGQS